MKNKTAGLRTGGKRRDVPGIAPRRIAAEAMRRAQRERRPLEEALALAAGTALTEADFALARAIATVGFRRFGTINSAIRARLASDTLPDAGLLPEILVTGAAQLLFLDIPDHAAVDLAVELAKSDRLAMHYAPLVNALLRRIAADRESILATMTDIADVPPWLFERWSLQYGMEMAKDIAAMLCRQPSIDLTVMGDDVAFAAEIGGMRLPTGSVRLQAATRIGDLPGYSEGRFQVQDAASALPARFLGAQAGMRILDLCAAPGGKTAQLAFSGASVIAVERSASRAERLRENLNRLKLTAEIVIGDAGDFSGGPFDAVLLDAPCSATGTIRRHPEIAWTKTLQDILALARQQERLFAHAATLVRPGGVLVYSTCSLEFEEGERQVRQFLNSQTNFAISPIAPEEVAIETVALAHEGWLRILPCHFSAFGGVDGFFAARLRRST